MSEQEPTLWELLNPLRMYRCRPRDFVDYSHSICPGIGYQPGLICLLMLHVGCFQYFFSSWMTQGLHPELFWCFAPLAPIWLLFVSADIKFRLQKPTRRERAGFDNAVINWFGMTSTLLMYYAFVPVAVGGLIWWWIA